MGNGTSWLSSNYPILIIAVAIIGIIIYAIIRQYKARKATPIPRGEQPRQVQPAPAKAKTAPAPAPQPTPTRTGFGVGIFNGSPVSISKESGRANGWSVKPMQYKDYAQSNDEVGRLALLLATKLRDYENLRALLVASTEALNLLINAQVEELAPTINKLQTAIDRVQENETSKGG